jgi:hypothetical protein
VSRSYSPIPEGEEPEGYRSCVLTSASFRCLSRAPASPFVSRSSSRLLGAHSPVDTAGGEPAPPDTAGGAALPADTAWGGALAAREAALLRGLGAAAAFVRAAMRC